MSSEQLMIVILYCKKESTGYWSLLNSDDTLETLIFVTKTKILTLKDFVTLKNWKFKSRGGVEEILFDTLK